jgi:hypothetical protein
LAIAAGYEVVLSNSRGPQTLNDLVEELAPGIGLRYADVWADTKSPQLHHESANLPPHLDLSLICGLRPTSRAT